jgi:arsenate reductase
MPKSSPVTVRIAPDDERDDELAAVARRLGGAEPTIRNVDDGESAIGDVDVPPDAPLWLVEAAVLRAMRRRHILFLCVANSARSQLAEGLARALAPAGVRVSSAGSEPTSVRPQAVEALSEIGIDISGHRSTSVDEVERDVDAVITLCAEEACPVWLGDATRLHWPLPDPAGVEGSAQARLDAFRAVRDELDLRLRVLFGASPR